ncbi:MAG: hypothetical protein QM817_25090 [Archangium sp.]
MVFIVVLGAALLSVDLACTLLAAHDNCWGAVSLMIFVLPLATLAVAVMGHISGHVLRRQLGLTWLSALVLSWTLPLLSLVFAEVVLGPAASALFRAQGWVLHHSCC